MILCLPVILRAFPVGMFIVKYLLYFLSQERTERWAIRRVVSKELY